MLRLLLPLFLLVAFPAAPDDAAWRALRQGGHIILLRHAATVPGAGDPPGFRLENCATQRNLSDEGRAQARRLGEELRTRGVAIGRVLSSRWCRALETARLAFGRAEPFPPLDSFFDERQRGPAQTDAVRDLLRGDIGPGNLALVTHQVNIVALTGRSVRSGEALVLARGEDGALRLVGALPP